MQHFADFVRHPAARLGIRHEMAQNIMHVVAVRQLLVHGGEGLDRRDSVSKSFRHDVSVTAGDAALGRVRAILQRHCELH